MLESVLEESSENLTELVDRASELGYLTTQDILQLFPQAEESASLLDELFNCLNVFTEKNLTCPCFQRTV